MSDTNSAQEKQKAAKVRRKPEHGSILRPTFAASRHSADGTLWNRHQHGSGLLQRQCACRNHTVVGGEGDACRKKRETSFLQRSTIRVVPDNTLLSGPAEIYPFPTLGSTHDLSHIPTHSVGMQTKQSAQSPPTFPNIQRDSPDPIIHESECFVHGIFIQIDYDNRQVRPDQIRQLLRTLELISPDHVQHVPTITVGNRPPGGGGGSAHSGMPGGPYIRLNKNCFNSSWNRGAFNETLLHEVGHIVDWAYECMTHMRRENRAGYNALLSHPHRGRTQGPSEHFADAYAAYHLGRSMSRTRREALLSSRARPFAAA